MKITIPFEIDEEMAQGIPLEELQARLKTALLQGLAALVSDYPQGQEFEDLYEMVRGGRGAEADVRGQ